jgi:hypothetical protein
MINAMFGHMFGPIFRPGFPPTLGAATARVLRFATPAVVVAAALACGGGAPADPAIASARAIVDAHVGADLGVCQPDSGWGYAALRALDAAPDRAAAARAAAEDPALAALTTTPLFGRYHQSRTVPVASDADLTAALAAIPEWHDVRGVPVGFRFEVDGTVVRTKIASGASETGHWRVAAGAVEVTFDGAPQSAPITVGEWSFVLDLGPAGVYEPDPIVGDC